MSSAKFRKISDIFFPSSRFSVLCFLFSFLDSDDINTRSFVFQKSLSLCSIFFKPFSLCCSDGIISVFSSSTLLSFLFCYWPHPLNHIFLIRNHGKKRQCNNIITVLKEQNYPLRTAYLAKKKKLYRKKNEIKIFSDKRKIRESAVSRPAIQKKC